MLDDSCCRQINLGVRAAESEEGHVEAHCQAYVFDSIRMVQDVTFACWSGGTLCQDWHIASLYNILCTPCIAHAHTTPTCPAETYRVQLSGSSKPHSPLSLGICLSVETQIRIVQNHGGLENSGACCSLRAVLLPVDVHCKLCRIARQGQECGFTFERKASEYV